MEQHSSNINLTLTLPYLTVWLPNRMFGYRCKSTPRYPGLCSNYRRIHSKDISSKVTYLRTQFGFESLADCESNCESNLVSIVYNYHHSTKLCKLCMLENIMRLLTSSLLLWVRIKKAFNVKMGRNDLAPTPTITYHIAGNFQGRKRVWISRFCGYLLKFSPQNFGAWHLWQHLWNFPLQKFYFPPKVFSHENFLLDWIYDFKGTISQ